MCQQAKQQGKQYSPQGKQMANLERMVNQQIREVLTPCRPVKAGTEMKDRHRYSKMQRTTHIPKEERKHIETRTFRRAQRSHRKRL